MSTTHRIYTVRNNKTGKSYQVDADGMAKISGSKELQTKFTVIDERVAVTGPQSSMIPPEISEGVRKAVREVTAAKEQPTPGRKAQD